METIIMYSLKKSVMFMRGYVLVSEHFYGNKVISLIPKPMNSETTVRTGVVLILQTKSQASFRILCKGETICASEREDPKWSRAEGKPVGV